MLLDNAIEACRVRRRPRDPHPRPHPRPLARGDLEPPSHRCVERSHRRHELLRQTGQARRSGVHQLRALPARCCSTLAVSTGQPSDRRGSLQSVPPDSGRAGLSTFMHPNITAIPWTRMVHLSCANGATTLLTSWLNTLAFRQRPISCMIDDSVLMGSASRCLSPGGHKGSPLEADPRDRPPRCCRYPRCAWSRLHGRCCGLFAALSEAVVLLPMVSAEVARQVAFGMRPSGLFERVN